MVKYVPADCADKRRLPTFFSFNLRKSPKICGNIFIHKGIFKQPLKYAAPTELKESRNANLCYWHIAPTELAQKNNTIEFSEVGRYALAP